MHPTVYFIYFHNCVYRVWLSKEEPMSYSAVHLTGLSRYGTLMKWHMWKHCKYTSPESKHTPFNLLFCSTDPISFYCSMHIQVLLNTVHDAVPLSMTLCSRYGNGRHIVKLYWGIYGRHDVSIVIIAIQVWSSEWYLIH